MMLNGFHLFLMCCSLHYFHRNKVEALQRLCPFFCQCLE
uniref:Uncharacterized protein n=1 Tax=Anguilla anguilla TaxID=7936 RepID=A0A0E9T9M9_ANGAN